VLAFEYIDRSTTTVLAALDLVAILRSVAMQGGPDPDTVWNKHRLSEGVDREAVRLLSRTAGVMFTVRRFGRRPHVSLAIGVGHGPQECKHALHWSSWSANSAGRDRA